MYDAKTGRLTNINSSLSINTLQDNTYAWRSDGILESRLNSAGTSNQSETFGYDALNRLEEAKTYLGGALSRTLNTTYDKLGNISSKTSDVLGEVDVTGYQYGTTTNAGPHAVSDVVMNGIGTSLYYDANGNVKEYDVGNGEDKFISWNARNLPIQITVGSSASTTTPTARDEFRYGPGGQEASRYYKKSTYEVAGQQRIEHTFYVGSFEAVIPEVGPDLTRVKSVTSSTRRIGGWFIAGKRCRVKGAEGAGTEMFAVAERGICT